MLRKALRQEEAENAALRQKMKELEAGLAELEPEEEEKAEEEQVA